MRILHLLAGGNVGGIETLIRDYAKYSRHENSFIVLWGKDGKISSEVRKMGYSVIELELDSFAIFKGFERIKTFCINKKIDLVIAHHAAPLSHLYLLWVKRAIPSIKTIAYAHGAAEDMCRNTEKNGLWIRKNVFKISMRRANAVIAISNYVKESLVEMFGIPENKIRVIYNGTDLSRFGGIDLSRQREVKRIIYVGRLIEQKGVQLTLEALSDLKLRQDWTFTIVGDGPYRAELEKLALNFGIEERVYFLGECTDVPDQLKRADIFVHMPVWKEGFGITIIEAMASGLICVGENIGAIPEILNVENGFLIKQNDITGLSNCLNYLLDNINQPEIASLRMKSIERANDFSALKFSRELDEVAENI